MIDTDFESASRLWVQLQEKNDKLAKLEAELTEKRSVLQALEIMNYASMSQLFSIAASGDLATRTSAADAIKELNRIQATLSRKHEFIFTCRSYQLVVAMRALSFYCDGSYDMGAEAKAALATIGNPEESLNNLVQHILATHERGKLPLEQK